MANFRLFMQEALKEAHKAFLAGEVTVGCVIVDSNSNKIIARAHNQNIKDQDVTSHSEILAIKQAATIKKSRYLEDCHLYVTLEPCFMCAGAVALSRIKKIYYGASDKKFGAISNNCQIYHENSSYYKAEIYDNINCTECSQILKDFFQDKR